MSDGARFYDNLECYGSFVYLRGGARNSPFAQPSLVERIGIVRQERGVDRNRKRRDGRGGDDESVGDGASEYDGYVLVVETRIVERARNNNQNSNVMSSVLSSTLSGQLNNALSQVFETNNWNIGTNLSTGDKGWTDMEVEGIMSGQLLNNRLLINGNFGYRDNPMANTNFVGDFEAEWLITRSGDMRLKAYNETNDRYYTKTNLTTQGVGIMYKKDFNKWSDLYFWNKWRLRNKRKREEAEKVKPQQTDSITDKTAKSAVKRKRVQEQ